MPTLTETIERARDGLPPYVHERREAFLDDARVLSVSVHGTSPASFANLDVHSEHGHYWVSLSRPALERVRDAINAVLVSTDVAK